MHNKLHIFLGVWLAATLSNFCIYSHPKQQKKENVLIPFSFEKKPLIDIINFIASKKNLNIIMPQLAADRDILKKQTITYQPLDTETITITKAWDILHTFLELSGFSLLAKKKKLYTIVKNKPPQETATRDILPLYIGIPIKDLPKSDERIRYVYYLKNLKAPTQEDPNNPIAQIAKDLLAPGELLLADPKSNGIVVVSKISTITSLMKIIEELDKTGLRESIEVVPLNNISPDSLVKVFNLLKTAAGDSVSSPFLRESHASTFSYFNTDTKIIPDNRTNSVIIMGQTTAIERIKDFIYEHIDVLPQSGKSILHVYDLQYLDSEKFAPILQKIVSSQPTSAGQADQEVSNGVHRFFKGVQIVAEARTEIKSIEASTSSRIATENIILEKTTTEVKGIEQAINIGGNRLIITALQDDWLYLKSLIEKLDRPQPQVILEVAIVDFSVDKLDRIAATIRNKTDLMLPQGVDYLASHITPVNNNLLGTSPESLAQDLLAVLAPNNFTSQPQVTPGSTLISFNDPATPGIFALLQLLQRDLSSTIISHPFLVSSNNQKAIVESQEIRRARGQLVPETKGTYIIPIEDLVANLSVEIVPHLASLERLRLDVKIVIEDFLGSSLDRIRRALVTTAAMQSGQILAIGGLIRTEHNDSVTKTPLIADVPILGDFFRGDTKRTIKSDLIIFVSPTIVHPKFSQVSSNYTKSKINSVSKDLEDTDIFGSNKDPITHIFFKDQSADEGLLKDYLMHTQLYSESFKDTKEKEATDQELRKTTLMPLKTNTRPKKVLQGSKIKELLAYEDNPLDKGSVKKS